MKKVISSSNAPGAIGPYNQAIEAGGMVFVSGQLPIDAATGIMAEGAEAHQLHLVAFLEVGDDVALVTVEDVQHVALGERRLLGDLFRRVVGREDTVIVRRRFVHFLPGRFPGDKILTR